MEVMGSNEELPKSSRKGRKELRLIALCVFRELSGVYSDQVLRLVEVTSRSGSLAPNWG